MNVGLVTLSMWIGLTAFGALISLVNLYAARGDRAYQVGREAPQARRVLIAHVNLAFETMRVLAHSLLFVAGVMIARQQIDPSPPPVSLYVRGVILTVIVIFVLQTLIQFWLRRRLTKKEKP